MRGPLLTRCAQTQHTVATSVPWNLCSCWADGDLGCATSCTSTDCPGSQGPWEGDECVVCLRGGPRKALGSVRVGACVSRILDGVACSEQISKEPLPGFRPRGREALPRGTAPPVLLVGCSRGITLWSKNGARGKESVVKADAEEQEERLSVWGDWLCDRFNTDGRLSRKTCAQ